MLLSTVSITIVDGQNEECIANHTDYDHHPCLPMTINADKRINVTFSSNITSFDDWFPSICTNQSDYVNEYMFDGALQWNIHNLIVENYDFGDEYGLMRSESEYGDITCNHCSFINITSTDSEHSLFETHGSFRFHSSNFEGIFASTSMIYGYHDSNWYTGVIREFVLNDCNFIDIFSSSDIVKLDGQWNDVKLLWGETQRRVFSELWPPLRPYSENN